MTQPDIAPAPEAVYDLLYRLGLTAENTAFFHLAYTVRLAAAQPQRLLVPSWLYPETARHYRTNPERIKRDVQILSAEAWKNDPGQLSRMAGTPLDGAPPPARFLAILAAELLKDSAA